MQDVPKRPSNKIIGLAILALCIPIFLVSMAYLAVKSDEANQAEYQRIREQQALKFAQKNEVQQKVAER